LTTHVVAQSEGAGEPDTGLALLRNLDLMVLVAALPVFLLGGFPLLGYALPAAAWLLQRGIRRVATRRAVATGNRRAAIGVLGGTMVARIWLIGLAVLAAGLIERKAGVAAGLFAVALFTVSFLTVLIVTPLEQAERS
jgi:hypothetical protein